MKPKLVLGILAVALACTPATRGTTPSTHRPILLPSSDKLAAADQWFLGNAIRHELVGSPLKPSTRLIADGFGPYCAGAWTVAINNCTYGIASFSY
jgi:hypothetical protein